MDIKLCCFYDIIVILIIKITKYFAFKGITKKIITWVGTPNATPFDTETSKYTHN